MRKLLSMITLLLLTVTALACGTAGTAARMDDAAVQAMVNGWPQTARESAMMAIGKYGAPDEATPSMLVWHHDSGPWKRSIVYREEIQHDFPMPHKDVWEQVVDYRVPPEMFDELAQYDGSVIVERTKGELSARCDKEEANFLAVNLADDVVHGRRTVADARQFYAQQIQAVMRGEKSPYVTGLRFIPMSMAATADRDMPPSMLSS
jgi:hypothetical protein